eukprot:scaffold54592_cov31-Prasinocladus_malaysianus.AAC.1
MIRIKRSESRPQCDAGPGSNGSRDQQRAPCGHAAKPQQLLQQGAHAALPGEDPNTFPRPADRPVAAGWKDILGAALHTLLVDNNHPTTTTARPQRRISHAILHRWGRKRGNMILYGVPHDFLDAAAATADGAGCPGA